MAAILVKRVLDYTDPTGAYQFFFLAPDNHYTGIEVETGVSKLAEDSNQLDMPITNTDELALSPVASRKSLKVKVGTKNKYVPILLSGNKVGTADTDLTGKPYKQGTITRVMDSRKASYSETENSLSC